MLLSTWFRKGLVAYHQEISRVSITKSVPMPEFTHSSNPHYCPLNSWTQDYGLI